MSLNSSLNSEFISIEELIEWACLHNKNDRKEAITDLISLLKDADCYLYKQVSGIKPRMFRTSQPMLLKALQLRLDDFNDIPF
ncbi:hypothetical protein A4G19_02210 [Pasteurellaceae bacterium Macca]|nr:hypothetical protein [Pasteurellaceae bacterium Macca]